MVVKELVDNYKQLMEQNTIGYIQNLDNLLDVYGGNENNFYFRR